MMGAKIGYLIEEPWNSRSNLKDDPRPYRLKPIGIFDEEKRKGQADLAIKARSNR